MDIEYNDEFKFNDEEFKKGLEPNANAINENMEDPPKIDNPASSQINIIINYLQKTGLLRNQNICQKCGRKMNMVTQNSTIDKVIWRCHKRSPPHDERINIREGSIFENVHIKINILYFLLYYCFIENTSINTALIKSKDFCQQIGETSTTASSIIKFFSIIRQRIKNKMLLLWDKNLLGITINGNLGYSSVEIDESKVISSSNEIWWMFGIIDRQTKEARIRCVLNNRTKNRLLPIIKKYVYATPYLYEDNDDNEANFSIQTRVFSDCFRTYERNDFKNMGFILKKVNHSIWFGVGLIHTNTIESFWHQIKLLTDKFNGLNLEAIKKI